MILFGRRLFAHAQWAGRGLRMWLLEYRGNANNQAWLLSLAEGKPCWVEAPDNMEIPPSFQLDWDSAQALFDQMHTLGFKPSGDLHEPTRAMADHLADMRAIAFHKLGIGKS